MYLTGYIRNGSRWKANSRSHQLVLDGSRNCQPFDGDSDGWTPQSLVYSEAEAWNGGKRITTGHYGCWADVDTGVVRVYPIRGDWTKYIELSSMPSVTLTVNQVHDKYIELYKDAPTVRWSFIIMDKAVKTNIKVKAGYSGDGVFTMGFALEGLQRSGKRIYDGDTLICTLPAAHLEDSSSSPVPQDRTRAVDESISNGVLTITADLAGLTAPINIDPTLNLGDTENEGDMYAIKGWPTYNTGGNSEIAVRQRDTGTYIGRPCIRWDLSALPSGATITSATFKLYCYSTVNEQVGKNISCYRLTSTDWVPGTAVSAAQVGSSCWNKKVYNTTDWAAGAFSSSDWTDTDHATVVTTGSDASTWFQWDITNIIQWEVDNATGHSNLVVKFENETENTSAADWWIYNFASENHATTSWRPVLTIAYTTSTAYMDGGLGDSAVYMGAGNA